mgnify:FL=1
MMKAVVICLHSTQNTGTDEEDTIDFSTDGMYTYDGENACITYLESEVTGLTGTRTSVIVMPDRVSVQRDGFITSRMFFMEGEKTSFLYDTPAGSATLSVRARSIKKDFNESGGTLELDYVLDLEHAVVSRNKVRLDIRQIGQ